MINKNLQENTFKLPSNDRDQLVGIILRSLNTPNAEVDKAWEEKAIK